MLGLLDISLHWNFRYELRDNSTENYIIVFLNFKEAFQAIYDYEAQDDDEVSFRDGDLIINCVKIDDGWMCGTVHRTGKYGMLPANYVTSVRL